MVANRAGRLIVLAALVTSILYWASPYVAAARFVRAAQAGDVPALIERFDLPRIRISIARQFVRAYPVDPALLAGVDPVARQAAGLVAVTYVDAIIAEHFTPERLAAALAGRPVGPESASALRVPGVERVKGSWDIFVQAGFTGPVSFALDLDAGNGATLRLGLRLIGGTWRLVSVGLPREVIGEAFRLLQQRGR